MQLDVEMIFEGNIDETEVGKIKEGMPLILVIYKSLGVVNVKNVVTYFLVFLPMAI